MEPKGSIPRVQESATGPYPKPDESVQHPYTLLTILLSIIFTIFRLKFPLN